MKMKLTRRHKAWGIVCAVALVLVVAGLLGASGCGQKDQANNTATTMWFPGAETSGVADGGAAVDEAAAAPEANARDQAKTSVGASLATLEAGAGQKVMKEAVLDLEVEKGKFQSQFDRAQQLAGLYGGYVLSSNSAASGEEDVIESGTVAIRVPAGSFDKMMAEARKLGEVKYENTQTQDVTEEYTDLQARITNQQAYVNSVLALLTKAKTIDEILQVQQTLTYAQQELEQLKGRMQYLEGHTSFSTLTMNIRETGAEVTTEGEWGFGQALKDALHNVVDAFSAVVRGLGWLIPIVIILGIVAGIAYLIVRSVMRRKSQRPQDGGDKAS
jgi:hypothetical protein